MSEWQSIESAPKYVFVLIAQAGQPLPLVAKYCGDGWGWMNARGDYIGNEHPNSEPTHWQPLPAAPEPPGDAR